MISGERSFRLPTGGLVDRNRPLSFTFEGRTMQGYAGDTLASALLANRVRMVGRSFKYHRPRGIVGAGSDDPAGLVQIGGDAATTIPNLRATEVELYDGLAAEPQNCWPSLGLDIGAVNDLAAAFLPAGFYYKTFMERAGRWMAIEPLIRRAAGLGISPTAPDPDRYEHINRHCDVLVVGGGAAGLMAAHTASAGGARVILVEETALLGGRLLDKAPDAVRIDGQTGPGWVAALAADLATRAEVTVLTRACAFGYYGQNWVGVHEAVQDHIAPSDRDPRRPRQRIWRIRAGQVILATGAVERPLVFHGNDRPGIMLAGAVQTYLHRYGVAPGEVAVIATNNSAAWQTAFDLDDAGVEVAAIADTRAVPEPALVDAARSRGIPVHFPAAVIETAGRARVWQATIAGLGGVGRSGGMTLGGWTKRVWCDLVAVSGGWSPNAALFSQSRGKLGFDPGLQAFRPAQSWQAERSVGAANGTFDLQQGLAEAADAGAAAAAETGFAAPAASVPAVVTAVGEPVAYGVEGAWTLPSRRPAHRTRAFVDLQNDVTAKDLTLAAGEGYVSVEHAKRYTTLGMGTDQGKTSGLNGFGVLAAALDKPIDQVGVTTFRPPYKPIPFGAVAGAHVGAHFHPRRTTAMHEAHVNAGAVFEVVGDWLRARAYPKAGESFAAAVQRESKAARTSVGVLDASTLGKIDVRGPDAREFLNRVYTNAWKKLLPGRCRYGLMLNEDGMVFDDGVTACLADDHFHMTTTTGGAGTVLAWLEEYLQTEWPDLKVYLTSVTEQWAVASICGPQSPALMAALLDDFDSDPDAYPFMSHWESRVDGVSVRVFCISFTGEMSYEINIPARYGLWLWQRVMAVGARLGITPYGTEAMHLLRAEKGFIIVGQDTDGTVTPLDLGMAWAVKIGADFIGKRSLSRPDTARTDRRQLVGLSAQDPQTVLAEGAQVIARPNETPPKTPMLGYVTSSYFSPTLNRSIALALIAGGHGKMGETVFIARPDGPPIPALVTGCDFLTTAQPQGAAA